METSEKNRNYYMVRSGNGASEEILMKLYEKSCVAVGWSRIDFSHYQDAAAEEAKKEYYPKERGIASQVVGKKVNEIRRFTCIKKNDVIIIPYGSSIRIAFAEGRLFYDSSLYEDDLSNCLSVRYVKTEKGEFRTIARSELSEGLQRRLRVRGSTVSDLYEFQDEIEKIIASEDYDYKTEYNIRFESQKEKFKDTLLYNIRSGKTHLATGGIGLEHLVKELLECEGYSARVCSKRETAGIGDIDVKAIRSNFFQEEHIAVQIKHHSGESGSWGVEQLINAQKLETIDYTYVFITSAVADKDARREAENANIRVMDGDELVDWIFDRINDLKESTIEQLGISLIPQII